MLKYYSEYLEQKILEMYTEPAENYEFLSAEHIQYEMEMHYLVWDMITQWNLEDRLSGIEKSTREANINADENRPWILIPMEILKRLES